MRILVVGAGATGGYFGGRLLEAGRDVTFLVRPARAERLASSGLTIASPAGNITLRSPPTVLATHLRTSFDAVILSCKAYDLDVAIESFAPAVGPDTAVLPILNGMRHLDLRSTLGLARIACWAGRASSRRSSAMTDKSITSATSTGWNSGSESAGGGARIDAIAAAMSDAKFEAVSSEEIMLVMWEKWVFLAALAGITCLTRSAVGDIVAAGGADLTAALFDECRAIAAANGYPPRPDSLKASLRRLTNPGSLVTASMLDDVERQGRTEADHILGDLLRRRGRVSNGDHSLLRAAYIAVKAAEARGGTRVGHRRSRRRNRDELPMSSRLFGSTGQRPQAFHSEAASGNQSLATFL